MSARAGPACRVSVHDPRAFFMPRLHLPRPPRSAGSLPAAHPAPPHPSPASPALPCPAGLNLAVFLLIGRTSALTARVGGVVKDILLIGISVYLFDTAITTLTVVGYGIALAAIGWWVLLPAAARGGGGSRGGGGLDGRARHGGERWVMPTSIHGGRWMQGHAGAGRCLLQRAASLLVASHTGSSRAPSNSHTLSPPQAPAPPSHLPLAVPGLVVHSMSPLPPPLPLPSCRYNFLKLTETLAESKPLEPVKSQKELGEQHQELISAEPTTPGRSTVQRK